MSATSEEPGQTVAPSASSSDAVPRQRAVAARKTPLWARLLILAALGCAGFVLLCIVLVGVGVWWFVSPPRQVPTAALVAPSSLGVARTGALADDQGLREGLQQLSDELGAMQEDAQQGTPEWLRKMQGEQRGPPLGFMTIAVPDEATFVIERLPGSGRLGWALAANFRWLVRPVKLGHDLEDGPRRHEVDGVNVLEDRSGEVCTGFVGGTLIVASDLETMRVAVPRLQASRSSERAPELPPELPRLHEGWDAVGLLHDVRGERAALLELLGDARAARRLADRALAADFARLDVAVDWESGDRLRARLALEVVDELALEDWIAELEALLAEWTALAEARGMRLESRVDLQRDEIRVELALDGVRLWIADQVRGRNR